MNKEKIRDKVLKWNQNFPVDRWWREKYKIPFMSSRHQEISFLDQLFEFEEFRLIQELNVEAGEYTPNSGDYLKSDKSIFEQMRDEFENEFLDSEDG